jgi:hypothetical protein
VKYAAKKAMTHTIRVGFPLVVGMTVLLASLVKFVMPMKIFQNLCYRY